MTALTTNGQFTAKEYELIRRTVAKDCNDSEFDLAMHICRHTGLDPLRRQIYFFVFHKDDPAKRQMVPVTAIGGLRSMAERTGNYRPDENPASIRYDDTLKNTDTNPLGIVGAQVTVYKYAHGEWFPALGEAYWDEYVPLWNGKIDQKKTGWVKMPRIMIAKCAEAQALRKAWPDDFAGLYEESELDRALTMDMTPSQIAELGGQERRLEKIGGKDAIMIDWLDGKELARIPLKDVAERINAFIEENADAPNTLQAFQDRNKFSMQEFWARNKSDALEIKKRFEQVAADVSTSEADAATATSGDQQDSGGPRI